MFYKSIFLFNLILMTPKNVALYFHIKVYLQVFPLKCHFKFFLNLVSNKGHWLHSLKSPLGTSYLVNSLQFFSNVPIIIY